MMQHHARHFRIISDATRMIALYAFGRIFRESIGATNALKTQCALQETEPALARPWARPTPRASLTSPAYKDQRAHQAPVTDDNGFVVATAVLTCGKWLERWSLRISRDAYA